MEEEILAEKNKIERKRKWERKRYDSSLGWKATDVYILHAQEKAQASGDTRVYFHSFITQ